MRFIKPFLFQSKVAVVFILVLAILSSCKKMFPDDITLTKVELINYPSKDWDTGIGSEVSPDIYFSLYSTKKKKNNDYMKTETTWNVDTAQLPLTLKVSDSYGSIKFKKDEFNWYLHDEDSFNGDEQMASGKVVIDKDKEMMNIVSGDYSINIYYKVD